MTREQPLFTIQIQAPSLRKGHISVPMLLKICGDAQKAVAKQATGTKGDAELTLELVGLRKGSTVLDFAEAPSSQLPLAYMEGLVPAASEAVDCIGAALTSANRNRREWSASIVPGAIEALDDMGSVFDQGVESLKWIVPQQRGAGRKAAEFTPKTLARIKARRQELAIERRAETALTKPVPAEANSFFEGILEAADGRCRIGQIEGNPITVIFGTEQAARVLEALHRPVRGKVDPNSRKLVDISVADESSMDRGLFFETKSIDDLIAEQRVSPASNLEALSGTIPDEDIDAFLAEIYADRHRSIK